MNPIMQMEWLREGRGLRLTMTVVFYNSILAFITLLFMFFNTESFQEGYNYDTSAYLHQFLIVSSLQIASVLILTPMFLASLYTVDQANRNFDQFAMFKNFPRQLITARISLVVGMNMLLYISSIPIISLSCVYSNLSLLKLIRLALVILFVSFWSGAVTILCFSISKKITSSLVGTAVVHLVFLGGTLLLMEIIRAGSAAVGGSMSIAVTNLCMLLAALNPVVAYVGFYGNITGETGLIEMYFGRFGIDPTGKTFSFIYYKLSIILCLLVALGLIAWAIYSQEKLRKRQNEFVEGKVI